MAGTFCRTRIVKPLGDLTRAVAARPRIRRRVKAVIDATLQSKPKGMTHWSCRLMAANQGLSKSTVNNLWRSHNIKPHRTKTFKSSRDPKFLDKLTDVVGST